MTGWCIVLSSARSRLPISVADAQAAKGVSSQRFPKMDSQEYSKSTYYAFTQHLPYHIAAAVACALAVVIAGGAVALGVKFHTMAKDGANKAKTPGSRREQIDTRHSRLLRTPRQTCSHGRREPAHKVKTASRRVIQSISLHLFSLLLSHYLRRRNRLKTPSPDQKPHE